MIFVIKSVILLKKNLIVNQFIIKISENQNKALL